MNLRILKRSVLVSTFSVAACSSNPGKQQDPPPDNASFTARIALTPTEYNNTVADLLYLPHDGGQWPDTPAISDLAGRLGTASALTTTVFGTKVIPEDPWPWRFPPEIGVDQFEGMAQGQEPSSNQIEALHRAALHFGTYALASPQFFRCQGWPHLPAHEQKECAWDSIKRFAQRAYRRPTHGDEQARLESFWHSNLASGPISGPVDEAIALTIAGILQSPHFLYRVESSLAQPRSADPRWELASRMAYFLWDSMPDPELFAAAVRGDLDTAEGVATQARRMLEDPRAHKAVIHFHHQWLGTHKIFGVNPARRAFGPLFGIAPSPPTDTTGDDVWPGILEPIRYSMHFETELFVERTLFHNDGTLTALLTDSQGYMSSETEPIYGNQAQRIEGDEITPSIALVAASIGSKFDLTLYPAQFPPGQRSGILTLPSVLVLGAYAVQPGPILRGQRILERMACIELGSPPPGVEASLPPDTLDVQATNRQRTEASTAAAPCSGCHDTLNAPGFAFEHYDAIGQWRATDNDQPVDAHGTLNFVGEAPIHFNNAIDLSEQLAQSPTIRDCYVLRWSRYAVGDHLAPDAPEVAELQIQFRSNDNVKALLVSLVSSELFRSHRAGSSHPASENTGGAQ